MDNEDVKESMIDMRNDMWLKENYIDLMQKHPREWIAVLEQKIIATGSTKSDVQEKADEIVEGQEYSLYFIAPTAAATDVGFTHQ